MLDYIGSDRRVLSGHGLRTCVHADFGWVPLVGRTRIIFDTPNLESIRGGDLVLVHQFEPNQSVVTGCLCVCRLQHWVTVKALVLIIILVLATHLFENYSIDF